MAFSSGAFTLDAANPVTGTTISSTWAATVLNGIATGLSTCMLKDGSQVATAGIPFYAGTVSLPGIYLGTDTTTGWYRIGANNWGFSVSGAKLMDIAATTVAFPVGLKTTSGTVANVANNTATSIISLVAATAGLYLAFIYLSNGGTQYQAAALVSHDGTNAVLVNAFNSANMVLTVGSGAIQATQTSGVSQTVSYKQIFITG